jgi:hypothetical protein
VVSGDKENIPRMPGIHKDPNRAQLQLENSSDITGDIDSTLRQQTVKIMLKILVPRIPVISGILYILLSQLECIM